MIVLSYFYKFHPTHVNSNSNSELLFILTYGQVYLHCAAFTAFLATGRNQAEMFVKTKRGRGWRAAMSRPLFSLGKRSPAQSWPPGACQHAPWTRSPGVASARAQLPPWCPSWREAEATVPLQCPGLAADPPGSGARASAGPDPGVLAESGKQGYAREAVAQGNRQEQTPRWEMLFGVQGTPAPSTAVLATPWATSLHSF